MFRTPRNRLGVQTGLLIEQTQNRLKHILGLARKKEFDVIINACDAGREGELIFQYIMDIGNIKKPVKRLWMQSMTTGSILEAWDNLSEGEDMANLADAAKRRQRTLAAFRTLHGGAAHGWGVGVFFCMEYVGFCVECVGLHIESK